MHSIEDKKILDSLSVEEKNKMTTMMQFARRKTLIKTYNNRYLTKNERPHIDRGNEQYVLWCSNYSNRRGKMYIRPDAYAELKYIEEEYSEYYITKHPRSSMSVTRPHRHIYIKK